MPKWKTLKGEVSMLITSDILHYTISLSFTFPNPESDNPTEKLFNVLLVILQGKLSQLIAFQGILERIILARKRSKENFKARLLWYKFTDIGSSSTLSHTSWLYYHFPQIYSSVYALFTFNNNKINIGWMRNGLQTYTPRHMCLIHPFIPPPSSAFHKEIFSPFLSIDETCCFFYAFDKYRRWRVLEYELEALIKNQ